MNLKDLKRYARDHKMRGYSKLRKAELVQFIENYKENKQQNIVNVQPTMEGWMRGENNFRRKKDEEQFLKEHWPMPKNIEDPNKPKARTAFRIWQSECDCEQKKRKQLHQSDFYQLPEDIQQRYQEKHKEEKRKCEEQLKTYVTPSQEEIFKNMEKKSEPGRISEYYLARKLEKLGVQVEEKKKIACDWILDQEEIECDIVCPKFVVEAKAMKHYNSTGGEGNQGTAPEKIENIFTRYGNVPNVYNKKVLVVFCGAMKHNKHVRLLFDAFYHHNYHNNRNMKMLVKEYEKDFLIISYDMLTREFLEENDLV